MSNIITSEFDDSKKLYPALEYSFLLVFKEEILLKDLIKFMEENGYSYMKETVEKNTFTKNGDIFLIPDHIFLSDINSLKIKQLIFTHENLVKKYPSTVEIERIWNVFNRKTFNIELYLCEFDMFKTESYKKLINEEHPF